MTHTGMRLLNRILMGIILANLNLILLVNNFKMNGKESLIDQDLPTLTVYDLASKEDTELLAKVTDE